MVQFSKDYPGGFIDGPTGGTPITAQVENNIEQGIADEDVRNPSSPASVALNGLYGHDVRAWAPNTQYTAGQAVVAPTGDLVIAATTHLSAGSYSGLVSAGGNWNLSTTLFQAAAKVPDLLITGAITRNANEVITSAAVVWPDGTPGTFTTDSIDPSNAINGYHITYGSPTVIHTYTQPTITRDSTGAATNVPQIVVS